jgi:hypothetical protein
MPGSPHSPQNLASRSILTGIGSPCRWSCVVVRSSTAPKQRKEDIKMSNEQVKDVYTIVRNGEKAFWQKVGRAHVNKDGSWNVYLNALPLDGELNIRDRKSMETAQAE